MNKKNNRKGFTTVELVIVIAVIAILATVLIPTFSNLIGKANESAALQEATNAVKLITLHNVDPKTPDDKVFDDIILEVNGYYFGMINGQLVQASKKDDNTYEIEVTSSSKYTFKILSGVDANLKLDDVAYTATPNTGDSAIDVADLDETKVKIYTLSET